MWLLTLASALFASVAFCSGSSEAPPALPLTLVEGSLSQDFGEMERNTRLVHRVVLENRTDRTVSIAGYKRTCGGGAPVRASRGRIAPGQNVEITHRIRSGAQRGKQSRKAYLTLVDGVSTTTLEMLASWVVKAFLEYRPESLNFGQRSPGRGWRSEITLVTRGLDSPVRIIDIATSSSCLRAGPARRQRGGDVIKVPVVLSSECPVGGFASLVTIETDYGPEPTIEIPVRGKILAPLVPQPTYVHFGVVRAGTPQTKSIKLIATTRPEAEVKEILYDANVLACSLSPSGRRTWELEVRLKDTAPKGRFKGSVILKTNSKYPPEIALPVLALVR